MLKGLGCIFSLFCLSVFTSCELISPPGEIPSYLRIDTVKLKTNYPLQGSASNKINNAWIYIDNQLAGVFGVPCTIPVLSSGKHRVLVSAGVRVNHPEEM